MIIERDNPRACFDVTLKQYTWDDITGWMTKKIDTTIFWYIHTCIQLTDIHQSENADNFEEKAIV